MTEPSPEIQSQAASPETRADSTEWCLGLPLTENRPLTTAEAAELRAAARRLTARGRLFAAASAVVLLTLLPLAALAEPLMISGQPVWVAGLAILLVGMLSAAALLFLRASDALRQAKRLRGDAGSGYSKRFAGPVDGYEGTWPEGAQTGDSISIEVLPESRRLWLLNGRPHVKWEEVSWAEVARTPEFAAMAAAWVEPLQASNGQAAGGAPLDSNQHGQRDLTPAEIGEIRRRARQLWSRPLWPALFFTAWLCIPLALQMNGGEPLQLRASQYILIAFAVLSWLTFLGGALAAWKLNTDCDNGIVIIIRVPDAMLAEVKQGNAPPETGEAPSADAAHAADAGKTTVVELLPGSRIDWTENGKPAAWRKLPGA